MNTLAKWVMGLSLLWGLSWAGNQLVERLNWMIPGNVVGMLLLFFLLSTKLIREEWIDVSAGFLTKHLAFFFIPIAVGLLAYGDLLRTDGLALLVVLIISLVIGIIVTAVVAGQKGASS